MSDEKPCILVVDYHKTTQGVLQDLFSETEITVAGDAASAIKKASEKMPDLVILELSLAGHSGLEFLYEFRTYNDWKGIPVIIYSSVRLDPEVLKSKTWEQLDIAAYAYKPETSLRSLRLTVGKHIRLLQNA